MSVITKESRDIISLIDFTPLKGSRVLITGASGLVGVYLVGCLKAVKNEYNIDIHTWFRNDLQTEIQNLFSGCTHIKQDITNIDSFAELGSYDYIIHAAGYGQPGKFLEDKTKTISLNTTATIQLLNNLNPGGKFLFISTSELYSGLNSGKICETEIGTTNTNHPRASYIEGKRCGEAICYSYRDKGYDAKIARLSLAYGPGTQRGDERVLNALVKKGLTREAIELRDHGEAVRTYCYITDVVQMLWNILLHGSQSVYNVGGESETTILDLAELIGHELGKRVVIPATARTMPGSPKSVSLNLSTYLSEFLKPDFISLQEGIRRTIKWQKKLYNE